MLDRRLHPRRRLLRQGMLVFPGGRSTLPCIVLDLSAGGAQVQLGDWVGVPAQFELRIRNGARYRAEARNRRADRIGVHFLDEAL